MYESLLFVPRLSGARLISVAADGSRYWRESCVSIGPDLSASNQFNKIGVLSHVESTGITPSSSMILIIDSTVKNRGSLSPISLPHPFPFPRSLFYSSPNTTLLPTHLLSEHKLAPMNARQRQLRMQRIQQELASLSQMQQPEPIRSLSSAVSFLLGEVTRLSTENEQFREDNRLLQQENQRLVQENQRLRDEITRLTGGGGGMFGGGGPRYARPSSCRTEALSFSSIIPFF